MQNRLAIASVVLIALVGLTVWKMSARDAEVSPPATAEVKLPSFTRDQIDELEISAPERESVKLVKQAEQWKLAAPLSAEADETAVKTALDKLSELDITGVAATNDKNHERLEVSAEKGTHVIARGGGKTLLDAYIGRYQSGNTMLRLQDQKAVATVGGSIRFAFNKYVREWRDRSIASVEKDAVAEIVFENANGRFAFVRAGDGWEQAAGKGQKPIKDFDGTKVDSLVGTAAKLSATDFAASDVTADAAGVGEAPVARVSLRLSGDAGVEEVHYRVGNKAENNVYLVREGDDQIYLVSSWLGGRLTPDAGAFVKQEPAEAPPMPSPHALGSPGNPIQVPPIKMEQVKKP
jgi:hypothetical protein